MENNPQKFEQIFKIVSYTVAFSGLFSLFVSGGVGILVAGLAISAFILAWFLENSRWQIKERIGLVLILSAIPLFYIDWKFQIFGAIGTGFMAIGSLARLILFLCVIKLLQKKSDRDWIFIYLISFFEILLAASVSISPLFIVSLAIFLLSSISAVILFEIRKTFRQISEKTILSPIAEIKKIENFSARRLPVTAVALLLAIMVFALPLFFAFPRVGGAGFGNSSSGNRVTGFSDSVKLGEIGSLLQNDEIVMRVEFEQGDFQGLSNPRWRGVALDKFDNKSWSKTSYGNLERFAKTDSGFYIVDFPNENKNLVKYTVYLEPLETSVLFALARPIVVSRGNFLEVRKDDEGSLKVTRNGFDRTAYSVVSDVSLPAIEKLRNDKERYSTNFGRYLQLPANFDERISQFTAQITNGKTNRYEKARAVETYLQNNFGYTLDLKAGGDQPLSDFLFNVREGHCEYFASSMAIMLRTQGIATRVVNGFQTGEYNAAAGVYVVKQKDAHSWVEVYFPEENAWIAFDPTPFAGRTDAANAAGSNGIAGTFNTYLVALETFWIQYFVAYDNQEQRSLFSSVKSGFNKYQAKSTFWLNNVQERLSDWWREVRGDKGFQQSLIAIGYAIGYISAFFLGIIFLLWIFRKIRKAQFWQKFIGWLKNRNNATIIEFYERMQKVLAGKGFIRAEHQTPLEFAFELNMPEAVSITEKYNRVRFGEKDLSNDEAEEIENWLKDLETTKLHEAGTKKN
jgi:protein-glutamine gamma-glutamyltransferase